MDSDSSLDSPPRSENENSNSSVAGSPEPEVEPRSPAPVAQERSGSSLSSDGSVSSSGSTPARRGSSSRSRSRSPEEGPQDSSRNVASPVSAGTGSAPQSPIPEENPASPAVEDPLSPASQVSSASSADSRSRPGADDDHREPLSDGEDIGDPEPQSPPQQDSPAFKPHAKEDLSDVSDMESQDGLGDEDPAPSPERAPSPRDPPAAAAPVHESHHDALETELDFEAEEEEKKPRVEAPPSEDAQEEEGERSDGEVKDGEELEEGECTDGDDPRPEENEPRPICRFYNRGQCTWGSNCRFLHPGVTDKGNYCMFDMVRPLVPANGPPGYPDARFEKGGPPPFTSAPPAGERGPPAEPVQESAWERGLRHAKEMMRKATKRKETDMDFEEKKMNLGLGQEELDKENDFYTRPASPIVVSRMEEDYARWRQDDEEEYYRHAPAPESWPPRRVHYPADGRNIRIEAPYDYPPPHRGSGGDKFRGRGSPRAPPGDPPPELHYHRERRRRQSQGEPETSAKWRDRHEEPRDSRYQDAPPHRSRGDEWQDPWMRSKSPQRKVAPGGGRRQSYSSGSSYSSSSRSYSRSSSSSYSSRSRSRSHSRSYTPPAPSSSSNAKSGHKRGKVPLTSPQVPSRRHAEEPTAEPARQRQAARGAPPPEVRKGGSARVPPVPMSPPAIDRKVQAGRGRREPPSPPSAPERRPMTPPQPPVSEKLRNWSPPPKSSLPSKSSSTSATKTRTRPNKITPQKPTTKTRSSGSDSEDSGSSSDSSSSSSTSASSHKRSSPPTAYAKGAKRIVIDGREALANMVKIKALDALKVSGQKQQIKLTLKGSDNITSRSKDQLLSSQSRKRPAEQPASPPEPGAKGGKKPASRREELLKQLKAVEDAIRRKKHKPN